MAGATKEGMGPVLKESYGGKPAPQANRTAAVAGRMAPIKEGSRPGPKDRLADMRVCTRCGKNRMGGYCRECGFKTSARSGKES